MLRDVIARRGAEYGLLPCHLQKWKFSFQQSPAVRNLHVAPVLHFELTAKRDAVTPSTERIDPSGDIELTFLLPFFSRQSDPKTIQPRR